MKGHTCLWNMPGTSPPGREGLSGPGEASWPPISTSQRFKNRSWSQLLAHLFYSTSLSQTLCFRDPGYPSFLRPTGVSPAWWSIHSGSPSLYLLLYSPLPWMVPPTHLSKPPSNALSSWKPSLHHHSEVLPPPWNNAGPSFVCFSQAWPHSFNKNLLCSAHPVLCWYPETWQWETEVCVCMLGVGG